MKKIINLKLFVSVVLFILFIFPANAFANTLNNLSSVNIEKADKDTYKLNLIFKSKYQGNAFIQKRDKGNYYIFLPDTYFSHNKPKIKYKVRKDKSNIRVDAEKKPFITENKQSSYVRLAVNTNDDYSLKIVSESLDEKTTGFIPFMKGLFKTAFICLLIFGAALFSFNAMSKFNLNLNSVTLRKRVRNNTISADKNFDKLKSTDRKPKAAVKNSTSPNVNINKSLKTFSEDSFTCFDLEEKPSETTNKDVNYKKNINRKSVLLSNPQVKSRLNQTNPIKKKPVIDMPAAEDVIQTTNKEEKNAPELISVLNITPNIGFYLTNVGETLALFGFVKDNVFLLKKFADLSQINLQARFYDKHGENDLYIVKLDTYKAMIEISSTSMKELAVL